MRICNCICGFGDVVSALCGAIGTNVCHCTDGLCAGLSLIGQFCNILCSFKSLLQLFLPLCSMSIAISSIVLPYWAWGETDKVDVGLFKCCKTTKESENDCSSLYDCVPSDSKFNSLSQAAAGLLITYIVLNGLSILLATISYSDEPDVSQFCNGTHVFPAAAIGYIGIIVFLSGVIQSESYTRFPIRLSVHLAIISCAVYLSYAAVCFKEPKVLIGVPILTAVIYFVINMMSEISWIFSSGVFILVILGIIVCFVKYKN
ncbi:uncharacterized protein LOC128224779 [Mya arenaria]|uniref:uncharacterized protein LOC128224779 n=1 Tax=Mya arenaria TaxID=6604 RepID=UPI0022E6A24F|nr:uncharacterized protein LOC128224779 [Mya arenaria]